MVIGLGRRRKRMTEGETLSNGELWIEIAGLHPAEAYPALLVDIECSYQQNAHCDRESAERDPVVSRPPRCARFNHLDYRGFSRKPEDRRSRSYKKQQVCPQQRFSCTVKSQASQVREPRAQQDANQYGPCIAVRHGHEPVKAPTKKVTQSNRQSQINQSQHTPSSLISC